MEYPGSHLMLIRGLYFPSFYLCIAVLVALVATTVITTAAPVQAHEITPDALEEVDFAQLLNKQVPLDLMFRDETGRLIRLGDFFGKKPVILLFAYYECPNLCPLVLDGLLASLKQLTFHIGDEFGIVTVSLDPNETPQIAAEKKAGMIQRYGRPNAAAGWHFLTGEHEPIDRLAQTVGFQYAYDAESEQYAHAAGIVILTPQGKISRYFYGIEYSAQDLRLGLIEASANQIGSPVDQLLLRCYRYDPKTGKYTLAIMTLIRLAGLATVLGISSFLFVMFRREHM